MKSRQKSSSSSLYLLRQLLKPDASSSNSLTLTQFTLQRARVTPPVDSDCRDHLHVAKPTASASPVHAAAAPAAPPPK
eukprot:2276838-Pyramimonas_sp.AAC.1